MALMDVRGTVLSSFVTEVGGSHKVFTTLL